MRERQRAARRGAVALAYRARRKGVRKCELAARLALPVRTLYHWQKHSADRAKARGPQPRRGSAKQRQAVDDTLKKLGPQTGLPTLRALHPQLTHSELREILCNHRRDWRRANKRAMTRLYWTTPGSVWALDFTMPEAPIDGVFERVLVVRDLGSGFTLLALPCGGEDSDTVLIGLQSLFDEHVPPLIIKSDNGGAFIEARAQKLLAEKKVLHLFSPPYYPRYNGACEAGIGALKSRTKYLAELNLRPAAWSGDDLQRAREIANEIIRPWGHNKPTRAEVWNSRVASSEEQRVSLRELFARKRAEFFEQKIRPNRTVADEVRDQNHHQEAALRTGAGGTDAPAPRPGECAPTTLSKHEQASLERKAIADALAELGFLSHWRRQFTPPIKLGFRAKN